MTSSQMKKAVAAIIKTLEDEAEKLQVIAAECEELAELCDDAVDSLRRAIDSVGDA